MRTGKINALNFLIFYYYYEILTMFFHVEYPNYSRKVSFREVKTTIEEYTLSEKSSADKTAENLTCCRKFRPPKIFVRQKFFPPKYFVH